MRRKLIIMMIIISLLITYILVWNSLVIYFRTAQTRRLEEAFQYDNEIIARCYTENMEYDADAFWKAVERGERYNLFADVDCQAGIAAEYKTVTVILKCNEDIPADIVWNSTFTDTRGGVVLGENYRSIAHERDQKMYLYLDMNEYEIIGWFKETAAEQIYLFTEGLTLDEKRGIAQRLLFSGDRVFSSMTLASNMVENGIINNMYRYMSEQYLIQIQGDWEYVNTGGDETEFTIMDVLYSLVPKIIAGLLLFCLINLIMLLSVWISERSKEFVVKLVCGWQMSRIVFNAQKDMLWMLCTSCLTGGLAVCLSEWDGMAVIWENWNYILMAVCVLMGSSFLILAVEAVVVYIYLRRLQPAVLLGRQE